MRACFVAPAFLAACVALGGCSMQPTDTRATFESTSDMAPSTRPMAQLPAAAGEQISVLQSNLQGPLTQKIILQGDPATGGENRITVTVDLEQAAPGELDYKVPKPTEEQISKEIDDNLPGLAMSISPNWERNDFGPFGYAVGHAYGGVTCLYAWQWSPGHHERLIANPEAQAAESSQPKTATSVRVRLCKQGLGEAELVELVRHMAVFPPGSNAPYLDTTYGARPLVNADPLSSSGVARAFYLGGADPLDGATNLRRVAVTEDAEPRPAKRHVHHRRHAHQRHVRAVARQIYEPVNVSPLAGRGVAVPMPGEGDKSNPASSNALLAPLQHMQAAKVSAPGQPASDLPLPPAAAQAATPAGASSALPLPQ
jgi:Cellulose biosynthesis protein BcsN